MCFIWCLIDKAQLLTSSKMSGEQLGKPTRQGRTPPPSSGRAPQPCLAAPGKGPSPPGLGLLPLSPPTAPPGVPATAGVQPWPAGTGGISEPPAWHRFSAKSRLHARLPNTHQPGRSRRCCGSLGRGSGAGWIRAAHAGHGRCRCHGPGAGSEPVTVRERRVPCRARRSARGLGPRSPAEHRGWARLCRWHVRAGAGRPRCQAGLAASWHGGEAAGSASSGHHPGAGEGQQGDRLRSTLLPFSCCDEPPTACHRAGVPRGMAPSQAAAWLLGIPGWGTRNEQEAMKVTRRWLGDKARSFGLGPRTLSAVQCLTLPSLLCHSSQSSSAP